MFIGCFLLGLLCYAINCDKCNSPLLSFDLEIITKPKENSVKCQDFSLYDSNLDIPGYSLVGSNHSINNKVEVLAYIVKVQFLNIYWYQLLKQIC